MEPHQIAIVVLNDGETWTNLEGCEIRIVNREDADTQSDLRDIKTYYTYPVKNPHIQRVGTA